MTAAYNVQRTVALVSSPTLLPCQAGLITRSQFSRTPASSRTGCGGLPRSPVLVHPVEELAHLRGIGWLVEVTSATALSVSFLVPSLVPAADFDDRSVAATSQTA